MAALGEEELNPFNPNMFWNCRAGCPGNRAGICGKCRMAQWLPLLLMMIMRLSFEAFQSGWDAQATCIAAMAIMGFPNPHEERSDSGKITRHEAVSLNQYAGEFRGVHPRTRNFR